MAIEHFDGGTVVTGRHTRLYQMMVRAGALRLEIKGLRRSRGRTAYSIIKRQYGLKGNRESVLRQFERLIEEWKE